MQQVKIGDQVQIMRPFKVFRLFQDGSYDVCDDGGNCLKVNLNEISILKSKTKQEMKAMKKAVLDTAKQLCKANNTVTTLEIKTELRRDYPYYYWDQQTVSNYMAQLAGDGLFTYTDNGTYRTYSLVGKPATKTISTAKTIVVGVTGAKGYSGTVGTAGVKTSKKSQKSISQFTALAFADSKDFESVTLASGKSVDVYTIREQKKSPTGYIRPKLHNVVAITVGGKTYQVK